MINETPYRDFSARLHDRAAAARIPVNGVLELTHRCNLDCVHCYCNLAADDYRAQADEMDTGEVLGVIDQIADQGCLWLLVTGGECLLRPDFFEIWRHVKERGLIPTLFTNGTLITTETADFLADWPPFAVEITIYGARSASCEAVTRTAGSFEACRRGIGLLLARGLPLKLKTMVLTLNVRELAEMKEYARELGVPFRFDALVNPRLDHGRGPCRYRITPAEAARLEIEDKERFGLWRDFCEKFPAAPGGRELFSCGAGVTSFNIDPGGRLGLCGMVGAPAWDLRKGSFARGWGTMAAVRAGDPVAGPCDDCDLSALCGQCPGWSLAEHNTLDRPVDYLCRVAHELALGLGLGGEA